MNIDINKILLQLEENPTRENILDFSFALLQWMGIEPNAANKPQLLSPQTVKLKDYLVPAPQTVQPQLYRLSADNQNIRVRFAVVKKLKKDYIFQLVDNDPGRTSYQAAIQGIVNIPGKPAYIPQQPYFIHFVTTPDYDKLVLIFNQGDQKRIVSFRRRLTHTQYHRIILAWQDIGKKSKPEIADLLWASLDIKEVNKEFYKQIKERFDALSGLVKTQHTAAADNQVKQFTVRLIGRYIFCWFLKEKGIIDYSLISKAAVESTQNYYQQILLKLFFETLNTKVQDRSPIAHNKLFEKIPYLNGGLFDESEEDKLFTNLELDTWLLPFVEILESYDFTVDESSSQYQQVAVDPEMLGRIFENLLASQNEETEKLANQRKAFGAFYTPREIVDYMVNESIKAWLQTQWEQHLEVKSEDLNVRSDLEKKIEPLFAANVSTGELGKDEKDLLLKFLEQIKILDPACGSGAFPMGILHKLVELNEVLGPVKSRYKLKKDILSQNIYGVDIMPMAIEIARLRAWLSLVLEENYNPKDTVHNFGVKPLPNLDFKFVCANSLIDSGYEEFLKKLEAGNGTLTLMRMDAEIQKLEIIRDDYFDTKGNQEKRETLRKEFTETKKYIEAEFQSLKKSWALDDFFTKINDWNPFDDSHASSFFSPSWMFGRRVKDGFDVVIGNPPYVQMQKNNGFLAEQLKDVGYSTFERMGDVYSIFYELGFKVLRKKGIHTFITSSQWMKAGYGKSLRKLFVSKNPLKLIALGPGVFESAVVDTNILIAQNEENKNHLMGGVVDKPEQLNCLNNLPYYPMPYVTVEKWVILDDGKQTLNEKIKAKGKELRQWKIKINFGIKTGYNEAFIIDEAKRNELVNSDAENAEIIKPILRGREIEKYFTEWDGGFLISTFPSLNVNIDKYKAVKNYLESFLPKLKQTGETFTNTEGEKEKTRKKTGNKWFETQDPIGYYRELSKEKMIWKRIGSQLRFSYSDNEIYCLDSTCIATGEKIKYLTALLNSRLCNYQLFEAAPRTGMGDLIISVQALEPLLVYYPTDKEQKQIEKLVDEILKKKKSNQDTTALEKEIDVLVYKLHELTYNEVKIVDKDFWLSEEEYEKIKVGE